MRHPLFVRHRATAKHEVELEVNDAVQRANLLSDERHLALATHPSHRQLGHDERRRQLGILGLGMPVSRHDAIGVAEPPSRGFVIMNSSHGHNRRTSEKK